MELFIHTFEETIAIMSKVQFTESSDNEWEQVTEGVEKKILRAESGENRMLIRIEAGKRFPTHFHEVPDEVYVLEGTYVDPQVEEGRQFGPGSYLYYPAGTDHNATSPSGCEILVWNKKNPRES